MMEEESECPAKDIMGPTLDSPASLSVELTESVHFYQHSVDNPIPSSASFSSLPLRPVTDEELEHIIFPSDENFDIVDGVLVWNRMSAGTKMHQSLLVLHSALFLLGEEYMTAQEKVQRVKADIDGAQEGMRVVHLLLKNKSASPTSSQENPSPPRPRKETYAYFSSRNPAHEAVEYTSSNYKTDFYAKWREYRRTRIKLYVIFDTFEQKTKRTPRVIVGSIKQLPNSHLGDNGDPGIVGTPSSSSLRADTMYYKKVYAGCDVLNVGAYECYNFKVEDWMSVAFMNNEVEKRRQRNSGLQREVAQLAAQLKQLKKKLDDAKKHYKQVIAQKNEKIEQLKKQLKRTRRSYGGSSSTHAAPTSQTTCAPPPAVHSPAKKKIMKSVTV